MVDAFGTQILVGDTVAVAHRSGSRAYITRATVSSFSEKGELILKWPRCLRKYMGSISALVVNNG